MNKILFRSKVPVARYMTIIILCEIAIIGLHLCVAILTSKRKILDEALGERIPPRLIEADFRVDHYSTSCNIIMVLFGGHLLTNQNLFACSSYHPRQFHRISLQSGLHFLSNVAYTQTDRQTSKPTLPKT